MYPARKFGVVEGVKQIIKAGFPAIDMTFYGDYDFALNDNYKETARELKSIAEASGVVFNQAHAPFGGRQSVYFKNSVPNFPKAFRFASLLGIKNIVVHPVQLDKRYYGNEEEYFEVNMKFYNSLIPLAEENEIKICIENMWCPHPVTRHIENDVCSDPRELIRYYDSLNRPDVFAICLDLGHVALCQREPEDAIRLIGGERLGAIHAHDVDYADDLHTLPGCGKLNWDNICSALSDIRYRGDFTLEADEFLRNFPLDFYPTALKFMNDRAKYLAEKIKV